MLITNSKTKFQPFTLFKPTFHTVSLKLQVIHYSYCQNSQKTLLYQYNFKQ